MSHPQFACAILAIASFLFCVAPACADGDFRVDGHDRFRIGSQDGSGETTYAGVQHITTKRVGRATRYTAHVTYTKTDRGTRSTATARFVSTLAPDGEQHDVTNADPDYLTVLNQPFAIQLDVATFRDLTRLVGAVPFDLPSPITGATLHGTIKRAVSSVTRTSHLLGVAFEAAGPLAGALPDRPNLKLVGTVSMRGTAYYTYTTYELVALTAVLAIDGTVASGGTNDSVAIEYLRRLRSTTLKAADL